jgi:hypothetical protein
MQLFYIIDTCIALRALKAMKVKPCNSNNGCMRVFGEREEALDSLIIDNRWELLEISIILSRRSARDG